MAWVLAAFHARADMDLLTLYPTSLTAGDTAPERARAWDFTDQDIFRLTHFTFEAGKDLHVETGPADLGIGHSVDGAVWAVVIPRDSGTTTSSAHDQPEAIAHIWLRFHPGQVDRLFPSATVARDGAAALVAAMRRIANHKMSSSWQAGGRAMIPNPDDMTVDVDTKSGVRRFFIVDTQKGSAEYVADFEQQIVQAPPPITPGEAQEAFDKLWESFDRDYAMFTLRPEVDWNASRSHFRPLALASRSTEELAEHCADMLRPLRDLHVWLTISGEYVPVFNRPRAANSNPAAHEHILGGLTNPGHVVQWAITTNKIGFLGIYAWDNPGIPGKCDEVLEEMRGTRAMIVDVRLNGGGSEDLALEVAGRFIDKPFVYACDQRRNGPGHADLTGKIERVVQPRGPWRYDRPVILLIGQKCMSSAESFVAMMSGDTNLTTMGDHTCGSSGNPEVIQLPLDMTVSVPQWIDYLPDGTALDERGFQPQVPFAPKPGAFEGERDDLLVAALERLRLAPLPDKPIPGDSAQPAKPK
jgi:Peptidase family S41/Tricorn protease C1 domain